MEGLEEKIARGVRSAAAQQARRGGISEGGAAWNENERCADASCGGGEK